MANHSRRVFWGWLLGSIGVSGCAFLAVFAVAVAVLGASFTGCQPASEPALASTGPAPSAYALQSIPPQRLELYEKAGRRFDLDWAFLASIATQECSEGDCAGTNSAGCAGPMQIAYVRASQCSPGPGPTLWERYAVNADPGHPLSVNDPADAIFTAARILREDMGAPPTGATYTEYHQAACHYYGACGDSTVAYAEEVMARAVQYGFTANGSPAASNPALAQPPEDTCTPSAPASTPVSSSQIVRVAESQIGQSEHPPGTDCTIYGPCEEWCSLFASWVWKHAGVPLPGPTTDYRYSGALYTWIQQHTHSVLAPNARPAPGDTVFFGTGPTASVHVAIVQHVLPNGQITTINGNDEHGEVGTAGPFLPSQATIQGQHIYGYAQPPAPQEQATQALARRITKHATAPGHSRKRQGARR